MGEPSDDEGLEFERGGRRFAAAHTEKAYPWQADRSVPLNRSAIVAGAFLGVVQLVVFWVLEPEGLWPWTVPLWARATRTSRCVPT